MKIFNNLENLRKSLKIDSRTFQSLKYDPESYIYQFQRSKNMKLMISEKTRYYKILGVTIFERIIENTEKQVLEPYRDHNMILNNLSVSYRGSEIQNL